MLAVRALACALLAGAACAPTVPAESGTRAGAMGAPPHDDARLDAGAACGADIGTRRPSAEPVPGVDLDGDGDVDLIFRDGHDMFGNADFLFYRVDGECAVFLGTITSFIVNVPHCVAPPPPERGAICRLSASRRMFHDDYQETFYEVVGGRLVEVGHGRYVPAPQRPMGKGRPR